MKPILSYRIAAVLGLAVACLRCGGIDTVRVQIQTGTPLAQVARLGNDTAVMLSVPAFPPWLGPFRAPSATADLSELIDLRSVVLPMAAERNDYRHVAREDITTSRFSPDDLARLRLPPKGIVFLRRRPTP